MASTAIGLGNCWEPVAVVLVSSGSRGRKLLFYHSGKTRDRVAKVQDVLSALGSILPEILAPSLKLVGQKFELIIDEWKFVGHPYTISALLPGSVNATIVFNVVFVLESYCSQEIVHAYDHLCHLIGSAIIHEELKCNFFSHQAMLIIQLLEETDLSQVNWDKILQESSLAQVLHSVLCSLQDGNKHVMIKINGWTEVNVLMKDPSQIKTTPASISTSIRSCSALLLLDTCDFVLASLPSSCNPALHRLIRAISPLKSLRNLALDADIPLSQVLQFASHLVNWGKALVIYPLSESNIYIASPSAVTSINSQLAAEFANCCAEVTLPELLQRFSLPVSLGDVKRFDNRMINIVIWLLQHKQIVQLHTYIYCIPFLLEKELTRLEDTGDSSIDASGNAMYCFSEEILKQSQFHDASDHEERFLFERVLKYFTGCHHLEEIMLLENIPRNQLLTLIDKFSDILATCLLPELSRD